MPPPEPAPARREALIVAADHYADPKLRALRAPARDAEELARVLGDPAVGDFQVGVSLNEPDHVVRRKLSEFFRDRGRDDLLLLHLSCHGLKDEDGTLYFASSNTTVEHLEATAIPSEFVNRQMTKSRSRRIVLLLDCCFGGAFARGLVHRAGESVALKEEFEGQGRVVLTASRAMEYAFEGDSREGDAQPSVFTSAIVHGLESGEADRDGDARVSIDELYDYVYERVRDATPNQTPSKWTFDVHGDLYVARSPLREPQPAELPAELRAATESPFAHVRAGAVEELARLLAGTDARLAAAARIALEDVADDDSKRVSEAAARALSGASTPRSPAPVPVAAPARGRPADAAPQPEAAGAEPGRSRAGEAVARAAGWKHALALGGAAAIVVGYFRRADWTTSWGHARDWHDELWWIWSPPQAAGAALLILLAVMGSRSGRLGREAAEGMLLAVGVLAAAATIAFVAPFELADAAVVTGAGALALLASALLGLKTGRAPEAALPSRTVPAVVAGAALGLSPLVINVVPWGTLRGYASVGGSVAVVAAAALALAALAALVRAPRGRLHAGGALVAIGALLALNLGGMLALVASGDGAGAIELGGPLGIAGGLVLAAAGARVVRAGRGPAPSATAVPAA